MRMFLTLGAKGFFEQVDFAGEDDMTPTEKKKIVHRMYCDGKPAAWWSESLAIFFLFIYSYSEL